MIIMKVSSLSGGATGNHLSKATSNQVEDSMKLYVTSLCLLGAAREISRSAHAEWTRLVQS